VLDAKARVITFWEKERGAMHALKVENDIPKAIGLFRQALELDPKHEDSRYYLGNCLAIQGDLQGALAQFEELTRLNPQSHRGYKRLGTLEAIFASSPADFDAAEAALERALAINPEETGSLMVLGEIALLRGQAGKAEQRLAWACRTNPKAVGPFFLRGYLAWEQGDASRAGDMLAAARRALGKDWTPKGGTAEGDVLQKLHTDATPLSGFWEAWDGSTDPATAFTSLDTHLRAKDVSGRR
jgi:tetratricopeptide (TPR) repeat protein